MAAVMASIVHPFNNNWNFITNGKRVRFSASIVHPFNNNWNISDLTELDPLIQLQSYILSTTTETSWKFSPSIITFPLQSYILSTTTETQLREHDCLGRSRLQSYILSTTTETRSNLGNIALFISFNRTSFQQQLKLIPKKGKIPPLTKLSLIFNR